MSRKNILDAIGGCFPSQEALYDYANRYWDGKKNAISFSTALRIAMNDDACPQCVDPFETLVETGYYANAEECGMAYDEKTKKYIFISQQECQTIQKP